MLVKESIDALDGMAIIVDDNYIINIYKNEDR